MSVLDEIRQRVEADSKIPHYRTGPGKCVCGFDAYRVGYYVYDYGEERQRHEDAAIKAGKKKATDAGRLLAAVDAVLALADVLDGRATTSHATAKQRYQEGDRVNAAAYQALELAQMQTSQELRAAVNDALEGK